MKRLSKFLFFATAVWSAVALRPLRADQQPVVSVAITNVSVLSGTGQVSLINLTNSGANYTLPPTVTFFGGSPTRPATAHATIGVSGTVDNVIVDDPGAGYVTAPTVVFSAPTNPPSGSLGVTAAASVFVGHPFPQPTQNESFGPAGTTIAITAIATGVFPAGGYSFEFFVNGVSIGTSVLHPGSGEPCTVPWAPPQPGAYFLTVKVTAGGITATSLPVRYFATGTMITSPTPNTIVPQGSSVVIQAVATPPPLTGSPGGSGYGPTVSISGGGAAVEGTATVSLSAGVVTEFVITNPGSGYTGVPRVRVVDPSGSGSGATGTAAALTAQNKLSGITVTSGGSNYGPTVTISGGHATTNARATVDVKAGVVVGITITNVGSGYTAGDIPVITISGGGGSGATAVPTPGATAGTWVGSFSLGPIPALPATNGVTLTSGGSGYGPSVVIDSNALTGATATAIVNGDGVHPGVVTGLHLTSGGSGYTGTPVVTISGGGGTGALNAATATVVGGVVTGFTGLPAGTGYGPLVVFSGGGGTGAAANVTLIDGAVQPAFNITSGGSGYTSPPTVSITGGAGVGANAVATVTGGAVTGLTLSYTSGGSGYGSVVFAGGAPTTPATASATVANGVVTGFTIVDPGSGYSSAPTITVSGGGGAGATALATIAGGKVTGYVGLVGSGPGGNTYGPTVLISGANPASNAAASATFFNGKVTAITVTAPGVGYTTTPVITLIGGGGTGANAAATVDGNTQTISSIVLTGSDSFVKRIDFYADGALVGSDTTFPYSLIYTPPNTPATHAIEVRAYDNNGVQISPDGSAVLGLSMVPPIGVPPTCQINSPANNAVLPIPSAPSPSGDIAVAVSAGTGTGLITKVELYIDGVLFGTGTTFPYNFTWHPTVVGTYHLIALAYDDKSNVVASSIAPASTTITIGATPTVTLTAPATGTAGVATVFTATATDSNVPPVISEVQFWTPDGNGTLIGDIVTASAPAGSYTATAGGGVYTFSYAWPLTTTGAQTVIARAFTSTTLGLHADSAPFTVTVSPVGGGGGGGGPIGQVPTGVAVTFPAASAQLPINVPTLITGTATDPDGHIGTMQFFVNGQPLASTSTYPYITSWTPTSLGNYQLTVKATDNDGNSVTSPVVAVSVVDLAQNPPTAASVDAPADKSTILLGTYTLRATATDAIGIANVQFFVNGLPLGSPVTTFPYTASWTPATPGVYKISMRATNVGGNQRTSPINTVTVSTSTLPTILLTSPIDGAAYGVGNPIALAATAPVGIVSMQYFAKDPTGVVVSAGSSTTAPFNVSFTPVVSGTFKDALAYTFTAVGSDSAGNLYDTSNSVTAKVFPLATPTVSILSPKATDGLTVNVPQTVIVAAGSSAASIASVDVTVNGTSLGAKSAYPYNFAWTPQSAGTYLLIATATDSQGAKSISTTVSVNVTASAPPTGSISAPTTGARYPVGNPVTLSADASTTAPGLTIAKVEFFSNSVSLGVKSSPPYTVTWTPTAAGNFSITAVATDTAGTTTTLGQPVTATQPIAGLPVAVTIGLNAPPTVTLTSPSAPATYALGQGVLLSATAADSDGTVTNVQFFANGLLLTSIATPPYSLSWVPQIAGTYQLTASATDNSGNVVTTTQRAVTISPAVATTVTITNPLASGSYPVGTPIPVSATIVGGNGPITLVQFFVNGLSIGTKAGSPYVSSWTPVAPGSYNLMAVATDSAGISTNSAVRTVTITADQPPLVTLTAPLSGSSVNAGTLVNLTASASDPDGTIASVAFLANGNLITTVSPQPNQPIVGTWMPTAAGTYTVIAQATDNVGAVTNSASILVNVFPNQPPSVALTSPAPGTTVRVGTGIAVTADASDADGVVASVQFFVNGLSIGTVTSPPYKVQWTPAAATTGAPYRLTAVAVDNSGAATTATTVLVNASTGASDSTVTTGTYQGAGEIGNFAVITPPLTGSGQTAVFIAYSTTVGVNKTYFYSGIPVDISGGFSLTDTAGISKIVGSVSDTGTSGNFDNGRLTFIGVDTRFLAGSNVIVPHYYAGGITGHATSALSAIVGSDGSIILYVADGSFTDAGGGGLGGKVRADGSFSVTSLRGNRFTGIVDPTTGALSGTLSGSNGGAFTGAIKSLGTPVSGKVSGAAAVVGSDIHVASNGFTYDQVLLQGSSATISADPGKITRLSYTDLNNNIVQVEFSGSGRLSIALDNASGPAPAVNYNQPDVSYMKGHAGLVITGADVTTNVAVFSVGRITAVNQALFKNDVTYDGVANISYLAIISNDGKFGGIRAANASFFATQGITGICAPGIQFTGPVYVGDISAADAASPMLLLGSAGDVRITGGSLWQANGQPVQVSGVTQLKFVSGTTSSGAALPAQTEKARLTENGADVTAKVVVNPSP